MPQLVFTDYGPQIVWLVITFVALYLLLSKLVLPSIARTLGERDQQLQGDIARAEKLKAEAESTLAAYRQAIGQARAAAQAEIKAVTESMAAEASRREGELAAFFAEKSKAVETGIVEAKTRAIADLKNVAGEAARELVTRLVGVAPTPPDVAEAVEAAGRERAAAMDASGRERA
jgi:F-type H+-transporting ATPase subunit b